MNSNPHSPGISVAETAEQSLEKIFQQVEQESERRAEEEHAQARATSPLDRDGNKLNLEALVTAVDTVRSRERRRGSVSISYFGQLAEPNLEKAPSGPSTPQVTTLASQSAFYQAQAQNASNHTLASELSADDAHTEDVNHVTQIQQIAPKSPALTKAIGGFMPRRLSRARSTNVLSARNANVVVDVSVQQATVEGSHVDKEDEQSTTVHAPAGPLKNHKSTMSMSAVPQPRPGWIARAKGFTKKFRRKSKQDLASAAVKASA